MESLMNTGYEMEIHQRPSGAIRDEIVSIAQELTAGWFTPNVPNDTYHDLGFQDVMILKVPEKLSLSSCLPAWMGRSNYP